MTQSIAVSTVIEAMLESNQYGTDARGASETVTRTDMSENGSCSKQL